MEGVDNRLHHCMIQGVVVSCSFPLHAGGSRPLGLRRLSLIKTMTPSRVLGRAAATKPSVVVLLLIIMIVVLGDSNDGGDRWDGMSAVSVWCVVLRIAHRE